MLIWRRGARRQMVSPVVWQGLAPWRGLAPGTPKAGATVHRVFKEEPGQLEARARQGTGRKTRSPGAGHTDCPLSPLSQVRCHNLPAHWRTILTRSLYLPQNMASPGIVSWCCKNCRDRQYSTWRGPLSEVRVMPFLQLLVFPSLSAILGASRQAKCHREQQTPQYGIPAPAATAATAATAAATLAWFKFASDATDPKPWTRHFQAKIDVCSMPR